MPWIVVVPLGVMVVGMMIGFARQFSSSGRERAKAHGAAGTAGTWLIFVSFVELAIGIGSLVGARRAPGAGGGYAISATVLLGVGAILLVIGAFLKIRGRRRARIYHSGVPGEAVIRAVHETGTMVNNQPMYGFDLDVTGQGFAPVSTRHREVIPFWFLNRIGPQSRVPVKVDPSNPARVIFDWDRFAAATPAGPSAPGAASFGGVPEAPAAGQVAGGAMPSPDSIADAMRTASELAGRAGSGWHAGKMIGGAIGLFVLVVVGAALFFVARIFGEVSDVTSEVSDQVAEAVDEAGDAFGRPGKGAGGDTTIEVSRTAKGREPLSVSLAVPAGWVDVSSTVQERQGSVLVDVVMKPQDLSETRIVVARSIRFMQDPAPPGAGISTVRKAIEQEIGDALVRSRLVRLAGEEAVALDIGPGADGLQTRQIAVMRDGQVLFVSLTAPKTEWRAMLEVFDGVLDSWQWGTASA